MSVNIFDPTFYRAANADLTRLSDYELSVHLQTYGLNEGRQFSPIVNLQTYRASNPDLAALSNQELYAHLQTYGVAEGRHFSSFVDLNFYRLANSDLFQFNNEQLFAHLQQYGLNESFREISADFSPKFYIGLYNDLAQAGLSTPGQALYHLNIYGLDEGRTFSPIVDLNYYRSVNADLSSLTPRQALLHLEQYGFNEGRSFSPFLDVSYYRANNTDLQAAGLTGRGLLGHFEYYGIYEGRQGRTDAAGGNFASAQPLSITPNSRFYIDYVGLNDRDDYYQFSVAQTSVFALIALSFSSNNVFGELLNSSGQVLQSGNLTANATDQADFFTYLQPGTYYLHFQAIGAATNYSFILAAA